MGHRAPFHFNLVPHDEIIFTITTYVISLPAFPQYSLSLFFLPLVFLQSSFLYISPWGFHPLLFSKGPFLSQTLGAHEERGFKLEVAVTLFVEVDGNASTVWVALHSLGLQTTDLLLFSAPCITSPSITTKAVTSSLYALTSLKK